MLSLGYDELHHKSHSLLISSKCLAVGTAWKRESVVVIEVSLSIAGSGNGHVIRARRTDLTCCASSLAQFGVSGLAKQCSFFSVNCEFPLCG